MTDQKLPFCYTLIRCGDGGQDLLLKRIREPATPPNQFADRDTT